MDVCIVGESFCALPKKHNNHKGGDGTPPLRIYEKKSKQSELYFKKLHLFIYYIKSQKGGSDSESSRRRLQLNRRAERDFL